MFSENDVYILREWEVGDLVGMLLTYVDATYSDKEQREAQKSIIKRTVYGWKNDLVFDWVTDHIKFNEAINIAIDKECERQTGGQHSGQRGDK